MTKTSPRAELPAADDRTWTALADILRFVEVGLSLAGRGKVWYDDDPANVPGLAAESLVMKIGEAVSRLPINFRQLHPEVDWRAIKDMRILLSHNYEATNYQVVWFTLTKDFPELKQRIDQIMKSKKTPL
jgi:uncharacterized protein with HEPN domain